MSTAPETVLHRVRAVVGTAGVERLDPGGARLLLAALLYEGQPVPDWHEQAACRECEPELFFPDPGEEEQARAAKAVCATCPVRAICLADVMAWERPTARYGVAGGLSVTERHQLHRATRRTSRGDEAA